MTLLREACPSYETSWTQYIEENYTEGDEPLVYIDLAHFARHLVDLYEQNKLDEFPAVFEVVEMLHKNGDEYVQESITVGLLEDIQNHLLANKVSLDSWKPFLKEESLKWWNHFGEVLVESLIKAYVNVAYRVRFWGNLSSRKKILEPLNK